MYVDLPHHFKGTHMSRFLEVLNQYDGAMSVEKLPELLEEMLERLNAETAHFEVAFTYFVKKRAPVTGAEALMPYEVTFDAAAGAQDRLRAVGGGAGDHPVPVLQGDLRPRRPQPARHGQRVGALRDLVWIEEIVELVEDAASCDLYPILKREDEKWVTEKAYDNPRFVEDMVREVTLRLRGHEKIEWFQVHVENHESIHAHNAYAFVEEWVDCGSDD